MSIQDKDCVLTSKGYAIKKSFLNEIQIQGLRSELTMAPKVLDKFQKDIQNFPIYMESKTRFYVPRHWGIKKFGKPEVDIVSDGLELPETITFSTKFPPYDFQKEIIESFINKGGNGIISVVCGQGKTFMALNIAVKLKRKFLIIVDKEFLMNQWKSEIENFINGATVGILQSSVCQIGSNIIFEKEYNINELKQLCRDYKLKVSGTKYELIKRLNDIGIDTTPKSRTINYDVTICMIQTICRQEFPEGFFDDYGFTIFDECHHLGASYFSNALKKIQTKYMLGLSATPNREDGLEKIFEYYLGDYTIKQTQRAPDSEAVVKAVWFNSEDIKYKEPPVDWKGDIISARLINQIADYEPRNNKIINIMDEYINDNNRYILLLSDRITHLEWFEKTINNMYPDCKIGFYIGGMPQVKLDENAEKCKILLATYQMCSEAFSIKKLNTIILTTPRKKVEQSTGRIFRERINERKVAPHIIDIIDSHTQLIRRWWVRQKFYKECEYTFQHIDKPKKVVQKIDANEHGSLFRF
jgi:superfamily II DNA or RNA helicase